MHAPIALFVYKRPEHARRTVESLQRNPEAAQSDLWIFCDAAKKPDDEAGVAQTRALARGVTGFASVRVIEREVNFGLARSIVGGVTQLCADRGRVIVIEDDLQLSPFFLRYMNQALELYRDDPRVASVHGYCYPAESPLPETFFMRGADCWGWGTWSRAWSAFEPDAGKLLERLHARGLASRFDFEGDAGFIKMLKDYSAGKNDSWAIRWHASAYVRDMYTLYPGRSLVRNIGHDNSGEHSGGDDVYDAGLADRAIVLARQPVEEDPRARAAFKRHFRAARHGLLERIWRRARRLAGRA